MTPSDSPPTPPHSHSAARSSFSLPREAWGRDERSSLLGGSRSAKRASRFPAMTAESCSALPMPSLRALAKQSILGTGKKAGLLRRCTPRNDEADSPPTPPRSRCAIRASLLNVEPSENSEGAGNAGCAMHPQPRVEKNRTTRASSLRSHRIHPAFPAQWFTTYIALSPVIGLGCHRRQQNDFRQLDASIEASGPHDFAVRLRAVRQPHVCVHRIPSRGRDDRERP